MVLVNIISVIIMKYTISYREVCYPINILGMQF